MTTSFFGRNSGAYKFDVELNLRYFHCYHVMVNKIVYIGQFTSNKDHNVPISGVDIHLYSPNGSNNKIFSDFCRLVLCISAAYVVMRCPSVCPSVRPSVRLSVCLLRSCILSKRINMSSELFSPSGSHSILVFCVSNAMAVF